MLSSIASGTGSLIKGTASGIGKVGGFLAPEIRKDVGINLSTIYKVILILIVLGAGYWFFGKKIKVLFKKKIHLPDAQYKSSDGGVTGQWLQAELPSIVTSLRSVLTATYWNPLGGSERCEAMQRVVDLNNNQIKAVANSYKNNYGFTMRQDLDGITRDGCLDFFVKESAYDKLRKKMDELSL